MHAQLVTFLIPLLLATLHRSSLACWSIPHLLRLKLPPSRIPRLMSIPHLPLPFRNLHNLHPRLSTLTHPPRDISGTQRRRRGT